LDSDSNDDRILSDAMMRHGKTPLVVRSGWATIKLGIGTMANAGTFALILVCRLTSWAVAMSLLHLVVVRNQPRSISPLLANLYMRRFVLGWKMPVGHCARDGRHTALVEDRPQRSDRVCMTAIEGSLDDLARLPTLQNFVAATNAEVVSMGRRNNALWEHCMRQCRSCDDFGALLDVAETFNVQSLHPPLGADEVVKAARSAWQATERGENRFGRRGAFLSIAETDTMVSDPHLLALLAWLKAQNAPSRQFLIADGLAQILGWSLPQLRRCRRRLQEMGWIVLVRPPARGCAALYRWGAPSQSGNGLSISVGHCQNESGMTATVWRVASGDPR
jgi:hypothetical protein